MPPRAEKIVASLISLKIWGWTYIRTAPLFLLKNAIYALLHYIYFNYRYHPYFLHY